MTKTMKTAITMGTLGITCLIATTLTMAADLPVRGPLSFEAHDLDKNGSISEQELSTVREQRKAAMIKSGRLGLGNANAPTFAQMDSNNDGQISKEELTTGRTSQRGKGGRGMGKGSGKGMR